MLVQNHLYNATKGYPGKVALIERDRQVTFVELNERACRLASAFQQMGLSRGDRIAFMLENSIDMVIGLWATLMAGGVFVPINNAVKTDTLGFVLSDSGAKFLVAPGAHCQRVFSALRQSPETILIWHGATDAPGLQLAKLIADADGIVMNPKLIDQDLALLIYTSGSTGRARGVMMTHQTVCHNIWSIAEYMACAPEDVILCVLPLSHNYGLFQILTTTPAGSSVVLERSFAFPLDVLRQIEKHRVTGFPAVPSLFARFLDVVPGSGLDISSLKIMTNAAAALPPSHIERMRTLFPHISIISMYGVTEATRVSYLEPARLDAKMASVGRPIPNTEVYLVDEKGRRVPPGEIGELVVRGSSVMRGYWRRPDETARVLRDHDQIPGEKVFFTGDLFRMDEDGDLYFVGRRDDVFKCRGEKVSPREVENILYEREEIAEAAVIGVADPIDGMAVKAYVVLREGCVLTERALRVHCAARLEPWLQPKYFQFCESLPKTESGKITRRRLRAELRAAE